MIFMFIYVLLNAHLDIILVNNQLDAHFFSVYVYFDTVHASSNHVLIIRRISCINTTSGICHSMQATGRSPALSDIELSDIEFTLENIFRVAVCTLLTFNIYLTVHH